MEKLNLIVKNIVGEIKISDYLKRWVGFSSTLVTKVKFGGVSLNGTVVTMRAIVKDGDVISINFPEEESENIEPIDIPLDVLYEDEHILAVNKPSDMPTHPSRGNSLPTLANAVLDRLLHHSQIISIKGPSYRLKEKRTFIETSGKE